MQVSLVGNAFEISKIAGPHELTIVRNLPVRRYDGVKQLWYADLVKENWDALYAFDPGLVASVTRPGGSAYKIDVKGKNFLVVAPPTPANVDACRAIPDSRRWNSAETAWQCPTTRVNAQYLLNTFPRECWTDNAVKILSKLTAHEENTEELQVKKQEVHHMDEVNVTDHDFKTVPYTHQKKAFTLMRDQPVYALFMEQGTGKSKVFIDDACDAKKRGLIEAVLVICPNGVKTNWPEEIATHGNDVCPHVCFVWSAGLSSQETDKLKQSVIAGRLPWLVMNVEAFSTPKGAQFAAWYVAKYATCVVLDESSRIKNFKAKRTKAVIDVGKHAVRKRIGTGTPVTQGPLDVYSQFEFLDRSILGYSTFYAFRNRYAVMGGYDMREVVEYTNLDELQGLVDAYSYRVLKRDCLDLPDKIYQKIEVELTPEQRRLYKGMKEEMLATLGDSTCTVTMALTQMLRLQQIVGGFIQVDDEQANEEMFLNWLSGEEPPANVKAKKKIQVIEGGNPKLDALLEIGDDVQGKIIVWARFRPEIEMIRDCLVKKYGSQQVVTYYGSDNEQARTVARRRFQDPSDPCRWLVGNPDTAGIGLTLTEASAMVYFSNQFSLESRLQSEDRGHRIGQKKNLTIIDLVAKNTLDLYIMKTLREKKNVADVVTGDSWMQWI